MGLLDPSDDLRTGAGYDESTAPARLRGLYRDLAPDPNADYGTILPFARDKTTGEKRWALPSLLRDSLLGGLDLAAGTETGEVTPRAAATLLSASPASAASVPTGSVGIFGGRLAKGANLEALRRAKATGVNPHSSMLEPLDVLRDTGWFKAPDKRWKFEIGDRDAALRLAKGETPPAGSTLPTILDHEALYAHYPFLRDTKIDIFHDNPGVKASIVPGENAIGLNAQGLDQPISLRKSLLHEIQHLVQGKEGFAPGSNTTIAPVHLLPRELDEFVRTFPASARSEAYRRTMGETEARNVEARAGLSRADRLYKAPWQTQDYPDAGQIRPTSKSRFPYWQAGGLLDQGW